MKTKTFLSLIGGFVILIILVYAVYALFGTKRTLDNSDLSSSTPLTVGVPTSTPATSTGTPLTLSVYNNSQYNYKVFYTSDFTLFTQPQIAAYNFGAVDGSACDRAANSCFVLNKMPYANTNFDSAAVSVKILPNVNTVAACAVFDPNEIDSGNTGPAQTINGVTFMTAVGSDAGAGNFYTTHYNRAWYGNMCLEVNGVIHSTDPGVYSPPRPEFDPNAVWQQLDIVINSFRFTN